MSDNLNKAESQSPMIDCSHPWKEIQTVHEFGEIYEQCRLCDHIITSRIINNEKIEAVKDALTKSEEAKQPSVSKPLTLDRLKNLVGRNLRKNEPDYGRRQFVMGYNQAKDEIRERILTW
jgi:hypothetical protein